MSTVPVDAQDNHRSPAAANPTRRALAVIRAIPPIRLWAALGAAFLAAELLFLARWVTSPSFTPVDSGPDLPPTWMRVTLIAGQVLFVSGALVFLYKLLLVPWRRERRVTLDGLLCIAALLASPFDMLSNYRGYWFTYNS